MVVLMAADQFERGLRCLVRFSLRHSGGSGTHRCRRNCYGSRIDTNARSVFLSSTSGVDYDAWRGECSPSPMLTKTIRGKRAAISIRACACVEKRADDLAMDPHSDLLVDLLGASRSASLAGSNCFGYFLEVTAPNLSRGGGYR
jgi:hypothetical protein